MANPEKYEDDDKIISDVSKRQADGQSSMGGSFSQNPSRRQKGGLPRQEKDAAYWEQKFDALLENDDIDVPEDFYDEQILFEDPNDLMTIFEELQEVNLDRIQKSQDNEQILELRKQ